MWDAVTAFVAAKLLNSVARRLAKRGWIVLVTSPSGKSFTVTGR